MISLAVAFVYSNLTTLLDDPITVTVSEDVWVYPNASDPGADETFKVWGVGGKAVAPTPAEAESFGYGYLKFNLPEVPESKKLTGAWMVLKPAASMKVDVNAKDYPLEVRPLIGKFEEKTWTYDKSATVYPDNSVFGTGVVAPPDGLSEIGALEIRIDLMGKKSKFAEAFVKVGKNPMYFALTSKYDASESGREGIYRIYTKDRKEGDVKPKLVLKFE